MTLPARLYLRAQARKATYRAHQETDPVKLKQCLSDLQYYSSVFGEELFKVPVSGGKQNLVSLEEVAYLRYLQMAGSESSEKGHYSVEELESFQQTLQKFDERVDYVPTDRAELRKSVSSSLREQHQTALLLRNQETLRQIRVELETPEKSENNSNRLLRLEKLFDRVSTIRGYLKADTKKTSTQFYKTLFVKVAPVLGELMKDASLDTRQMQAVKEIVEQYWSTSGQPLPKHYELFLDRLSRKYTDATEVHALENTCRKAIKALDSRLIFEKQAWKDRKHELTCQLADLLCKRKKSQEALSLLESSIDHGGYRTEDCVRYVEFLEKWGLQRPSTGNIFANAIWEQGTRELAKNSLLRPAALSLLHRNPGPVQLAVRPVIQTFLEEKETLSKALLE